MITIVCDSLDGFPAALRPLARKQGNEWMVDLPEGWVIGDFRNLKSTFAKRRGELKRDLKKAEAFLALARKLDMKHTVQAIEAHLKRGRALLRDSAQ